MSSGPKRLLWYGNCQLDGLDRLMRLTNPRYLQTYEVNTFQAHLLNAAQDSKEVDRLMRCAEEADILIYHWLDTTPGKHKVTIPALKAVRKSGALLVPMSVAHNYGYFVYASAWSEALVNEARRLIFTIGLEEAIRYFAMQGDLGWVPRHRLCLDRMKAKEDSDGVPAELRMSGFVEEWGQRKRLFLTLNHPSTHLLLPWAKRVSKVLGVPYRRSDLWMKLPPNYVGLPCADYICPAAKAHLGLKFRADNQVDSMKAVAYALQTIQLDGKFPPSWVDVEG